MGNGNAGAYRYRVRTAPRRQRGLAYVGVLVMVGVVGIGLLQAASVWQKVRQREREVELLFVGDQIRQAIESYYKASPGGMYPKSLADLVEDTRSAKTRHHLRKSYRDPLGGATWGVVKTPDERIMGVYSQAPGMPLRQAEFAPPYESFAGKQSYRDWVFLYRPQRSGGG